MTAPGTEGDARLAPPTDPPGTEPLGTEPVTGRVARFARRHALFGAVLLAAAAVRVIVILGFRGALLTPDSTDYLADTVGKVMPGLVRPSGYPVMLWLLKPFHSLAVVVAVQHGLGLGLGVAGYALLRRLGLPGWGATLAMVPVLLSAYALQLEHFLLSDTLYALLVMLAVVLMAWWPAPPVWACALAGLLLAAAALARSEGVPLLIVFLACLLVRFSGWRTIAGVLVMSGAFAIPLAGYAAWFESYTGTFQITASDGAFLYAGVTAFADCARIKPPPAERRLCLNVPVSERASPQTYVWISTSPIKNIPGGEFGKQADALGTSFALRAIRAQPLDYLRAVGSSFWIIFQPHPRTSAFAQGLRAYMFPAADHLPALWARHYYYAYDPAGPGLRVIQPYAGWARAYQRYIVVPGPLLGVIMLVGLGGLIMAWRRIGGPALLPWLTGLVLLLTPAAIVVYSPRYLVCAIPPLCVAAAIGVQQMAGPARRLIAGLRPSDLLGPSPDHRRLPSAAARNWTAPADLRWLAFGG
jgi:hypothetical protein